MIELLFMGYRSSSEDHALLVQLTRGEGVFGTTVERARPAEPLSRGRALPVR